MLALGSRQAGWGIAFLVSAGIMHEIMAKDVSSPQTTHLNAGTRAPTLMYWVHIGQIEGAAFLAVAVIMDRQHRIPILLGGLSAMAINEIEYVHAKNRGLAEGGPPTEQHNGGYGYGSPY